MQLHQGAAIGEGGTVAGVEVAFAGQPLSQKYVVPSEFDMPVSDVIDPLLRD